jgi:hypothetical protein
LNFIDDNVIGVIGMIGKHIIATIWGQFIQNALEIESLEVELWK